MWGKNTHERIDSFYKHSTILPASPVALLYSAKYKWPQMIYTLKLTYPSIHFTGTQVPLFFQRVRLQMSRSLN